VQLQLSATVAVRCQRGSAARGAVSAANSKVTATSWLRMGLRLVAFLAAVNGNPRCILFAT